MEGVNAPQVYTAAKLWFCLYFLIIFSFFFCYLGCSGHCEDVTYTWLFSHEGFASEWQWPAQIHRLTCEDWVFSAIMSHSTVTYTNVISHFIIQPLSLITPCAFHHSQPLLLMPWLTWCYLSLFSNHPLFQTVSVFLEQHRSHCWWPPFSVRTTYFLFCLIFLTNNLALRGAARFVLSLLLFCNNSGHCGASFGSAQTTATRFFPFTCWLLQRP